ncbi:hypothetical protein FHX48_001824 [Microbacterium halimionae]|uniref:DUF4190 domain-containing protein n=1 Tax=Microbacterium halimionae TaxID=1526413 RepID=A0A7W3PM59_9MICO|nr:hypothetical protein [Microbacterium halimionae]MBA8816731.1 hypothetical protein [Microbacterium halimionae]NII94973.1 hypothetical protein [Microbacterium halimionae]
MTDPTSPDASRTPAPPFAAPAAVPSPAAPAAAPTALPGAHRGGYQRELTAPLDIVVQSQTEYPSVPWQPPATAPVSPPVQGAFSGWALGFAVAGLVFSFFVGWGFPLGIVAIATAILALRRPLESRRVAVWSIVLATLSIAYSALWLVASAQQAGMIN